MQFKPIETGRQVLRDAVVITLDLYKIMIPVILAVKLLEELDLIRYLAWPLEPLMGLAGLPAATGLVWATAMAVNLYSAIIVYAQLLSSMDALSVAQVTVLGTMLLMAHSLPVELKIAEKCRVNLWGQAAVRVGGAMVCGVLLHQIFTRLDLLQRPSAMLWTPPAPDADLWSWTMSQGQNLISVFLVILCLMIVMRLLTWLKVTDLINRLLGPFLRLMGIGRQAATITVIGLTMGIAYGGGLIIHEVRKGGLAQKDLFASLSLMGLSHALIEDTLLMALLGSHTLGILWGRLAFSLLAVAVLSRLYGRWAARRETA